jgi:Protein of unknown function (DUF 659)
MDKINISDYLRDLNTVTGRGTCKSCSKGVIWGRDKLSSHKRANCDNVTEEEKQIFKTNKKSKLATDLSQSFSSNCSSMSVDETFSQASIDEIEDAIGNFFFRTGISFRILDSPAFIRLITILNPEYAKKLMCSRTLSGRMLNKKYNQHMEQVKEILDSSESIVLTSDGWTNINGDHIVNFILKAPETQPFYYKSIDTSGIPQDAVAIAQARITMGNCFQNEPEKLLENFWSQRISNIISLC